ncbi:hypothetical protein DHC50_17505 [Arenibacter sp. A80]|nr:hypothetical protein [Arenibacter sp. A80]RFT54872.1 hypothetical protein D0S24_17500 [Arenibacter sp. P308M17]
MPHAFIIAMDGYLSWIKRDTMPIYLGKCVLSDFAYCLADMIIFPNTTKIGQGPCATFLGKNLGTIGLVFYRTN